jgi:hypothetical protein
MPRSKVATVGGETGGVARGFRAGAGERGAGFDWQAATSAARITDQALGKDRIGARKLVGTEGGILSAAKVHPDRSQGSLPMYGATSR